MANSHGALCSALWILGIGDRHLSNFLISTKNGIKSCRLLFSLYNDLKFCMNLFRRRDWNRLRLCVWYGNLSFTMA